MPLTQLRSRKRKVEYISTSCQTTRVVVTTPRRSPRIKHVTPPLALSVATGHHSTPQRVGVFLCKEIAFQKKIKIPTSEVQAFTGVPPRSQSEILKSKEVRMLHHSLEPQEPDPRAPLRQITRLQTQAIYNYLTDERIPPRERNKPWQDVFLAATGEPLPQTIHTEGFRDINPQTIQIWCRKDEGIGSFKREEEKELTPTQARKRREWINIQLPIRPHSVDWKDCAYCDEFHFGVQQEVTHTVKRPQGKEWRHHKMNVQLKKGTTSKDEKEKAREEGHLPLVNIFVVIGFNFRKTIRYEVNNEVGKMETDTYIKILKELQDDKEWQRQGLTLIQDADSAHTAKNVKSWCEKNNFASITLPGKSPDFSIAETLASVYKRRFHAQAVNTPEAGLSRFENIFHKEVDPEVIRRVYDGYTARFHECKRRDGQMTHF